jgi:hypothetical protein
MHERLDREVATKEAFEKSWSTRFNRLGAGPKIRKALMKDLEFHKAIAADSCNTLKPNPIRCALLVYDAYLELGGSGLTVERATGQICMMAHLYVATRILVPSSPKWPDMEFLFAQQEETRLFFGGLSKTFEECIRKVYLMMGRSATDMARAEKTRKRVGKSDKSSIHIKFNDGRWMQETGILAPIFKPRGYG